MDKHYAFLVNNRVENVLVFADADNDLAQRICTEHNYDGFIWLDDNDPPALWSTYDAKSKKFNTLNVTFIGNFRFNIKKRQ